MDRRRFLAGAATLALPGCVAARPGDGCDPSAPPPVGIRIANDDDGAHTVAIEVVRDLLVRVETVFEERYEVAAGERVAVSGVVDRAGRHVVVARLDGGAAVGHLYWAVSPEGCQPALVTVTDDGLSLSRPDGYATGPSLSGGSAP
jgi:hypothetical protein